MTQLTPDIEFIGARYRIESVIGIGGMGTVYRALDRLTGRHIALKRVKTKLNDLGFSSDSPDDNELALIKEFRTLSSLRHPYIIDVLDYGFDAERNPFFTMELLEGGQSIREYAAFATGEEILTRILEMLQVLMYLHRRGILHRDIKPSNLMVINGHVKILDFGLAKTLEARSSEYTKESMAGTIAYMAPELFKGENVSRASDLYAVGLIAYELLSGAHPFRGNNLAHLAYEIMNTEPDWLLMDNVSDDVIDIIDRLMLKDPKVRYRDAADAYMDLRKVLNSPPEEEAINIRESFLQAARFVGREKEYRTLRDALDAVKKGQGSAWLVTGESGVGKSRLLDEWRIRVLVRGVLILRGQATSERREIYHLWREIARNLAIEVELSDLEAQVLKQLVPDISRLIERDVPDATVVQPQAAIERLVNVFESVIRKYERPMVLILEDLHWSRESLDVLKHLVTLVDKLPLLLVGSYRNDARPDLPIELPTMEVITLPRLKRSEIQGLSESMLGTTGKNVGLVEMLERETEGNALFIIEVVRALAEEAGELENIGRVTLPRRVFSDGIRTVIQRRLEKVSQNEIEPLQLAAIAGRQIDLRVLRKAIPDYNWRRWLVQCADAAIFAVDEYHWRFAHDKIREGILDDVTAEKKQAFSKTIAEAIEAVYEDKDEYAAILTNHWHNAGNPKKELHYAFQVAEQLHRTSNLNAMRRYLERAIGLAEDVEISDAQRWTIEVRLAEAYVNLSDVAQARKMLKPLLEAIPSDAKSNTICTKLEAYYHYVVSNVAAGEFQQAHDAAYEAYKLIEKCDNKQQRAKTLWVIGMAEVFNGNYKTGQEFHQRCLDLAKEIDYPMFMTSAYIGLGSAVSLLGDVEQAIKYNTKALDLSRKMGNILYESYALHNMGAFLLSVERYEEALDYLTDAVVLDIKLNVLPSLSLSLINQAYCYIMLDRENEGLSTLKEGLELATETSSMPTVLFGIGTYGLLMARRSHHIEASELFAFILAHPKLQMDDHIIFGQLINHFGYDEATMLAAKERSQSLKMQTIVDIILSSG